MPLIKVETTVVIPEDKLKTLAAGLSKLVAETIGKPEQYVMVAIGQAAMLMSGKPGEAAFVDIRSIGGLRAAVNRKLSQTISILFEQSLGVPQNRIYLTLTAVAASDCG